MDPKRARETLDQERTRLMSLIDRIGSEGLETESEQESLSELSSADQHPADVGSETFERTKDLAILDGVRADLDDVTHALHRLGNGTYGLCEGCGKPIPDERLEALPAARFCLDDQTRYEREMRANTAGEPPHGTF
jgi:RNA polymerase-binding transcription factor DksA